MPDPVRRGIGPLAAAGLSFVWPGLGQLAQRRLVVAAVFGIPTVLVVALIVRLVLGDGRLEVAAATMLDPAVASAVLLAIVGVGLYRALAIWEAWRDGPARTRGRRAWSTLVALLLGVVLMHGIGGYYALAFYQAGTAIFTGDQPSPTQGPSQPPESLQPGETPTEGPSPGPTYPPSDRISVLLMGVDSGHDRAHALTDTMLVVSLSPSQGTLTMISFPRDISRFPLYFGGTYQTKLNSLMTAARNNPSAYPDPPATTLANELGYLLGIPIQYSAAINLEGFEQMVDIVGGVDVVNERAISDPTYDWFDGTYGFYLRAGPQHLDGRTALAFVRSRKGIGDNDFTRADRQQQLLVALRAKLLNGAMLTRLPDLLKAASATVTTNMPPAKLREYLGLADAISSAKVQRYVLGPPYATHPPTESTGGTYILELDLTRLAVLSVQLFGRDSRYFQEPAVSSPSPAVP
ncbi:MAG TPA: LCP family protein [Candidatus Limnocylindrales bacterium]